MVKTNHHTQRPLHILLCTELHPLLFFNLNENVWRDSILESSTRWNVLLLFFTKQNKLKKKNYRPTLKLQFFDRILNLYYPHWTKQQQVIEFFKQRLKVENYVSSLFFLYNGAHCRSCKMLTSFKS